LYHAGVARRNDSICPEHIGRKRRISIAVQALTRARRTLQRCSAGNWPDAHIYIKKVEKKPLFGYDKPELWNTVIKTASSGPTARTRS
jgi:hypothetical protein